MSKMSIIGSLLLVGFAILNFIAVTHAAVPGLRSNCPPGYVGPLQHPYDCTKYIKCLGDGQESFKDCPEFTAFNPLTYTCYYSYNVEGGCTGR